MIWKSIKTCGVCEEIYLNLPKLPVNLSVMIGSIQSQENMIGATSFCVDLDLSISLITFTPE